MPRTHALREVLHVPGHPRLGIGVDAPLQGWSRGGRGQRAHIRRWQGPFGVFGRESCAAFEHDRKLCPRNGWGSSQPAPAHVYRALPHRQQRGGEALFDGLRHVVGIHDAAQQAQRVPRQRRQLAGRAVLHLLLLGAGWWGGQHAAASVGGSGGAESLAAPPAHSARQPARSLQPPYLGACRRLLPVLVGGRQRCLHALHHAAHLLQ